MRFVVRLLGFEDSLDTSALTGAATVEAHGGGGGDGLEGSANADLLFGASLAAGTTAVVLYLISAPDPAEPTVSAVAGPDSIGFVVRGAF